MAVIISSNDWYSTLEDVNDALEQGDVIFDISNFTPIFDESTDFDSDNPVIKMLQEKNDAVILSQSCDINGQKGGKINILLAPIYPLSEFRRLNTNLGSEVGLEGIRQQRNPSYHMLNSCDIEGFELEIMVVDFRNIFTISLPNVWFMLGNGIKRMRMRSPYVEFLSAAYGRSIMRVGLPSDIPKFKIPDKNIVKFHRDFEMMSQEERRKVIDQLKELDQSY